jgi:hypothetical protein
MTAPLQSISNAFLTVIPQTGHSIFVFPFSEAAHVVFRTINFKISNNKNPWATTYNSIYEAPVLAICKIIKESGTGIERRSGKIWWIVFMGGNAKPQKSIRQEAEHLQWDIERVGDKSKEQSNEGVVQNLLEGMIMEMDGVGEVEGPGSVLRDGPTTVVEMRD